MRVRGDAWALQDVVTTLRYRSPLGRRLLSQYTHLPLGTVSAALQALYEAGIAVPLGSAPSTGGRPIQEWGLAADHGFLLGVSFDVTGVILALVDFAGGVRRQRLVPLPRVHPTPVELLDCVAEAATDLWREAGVPETKRLAVAMAVPGIYRPGLGILFLPNFPGWAGSDPVPLFSERLGLPVFMQNDANASAYAEWRLGAAQETASFLYVTVAEGTGGALVLDGRPIAGNSGSAGELGHFPVGGNHRCNCGLTGCLETEASGLALRRLQAEGKSEAEVVEHLSRYLALALSALTNVLAPEAVVMGGWVTERHPELVFATAQKARAHTLPLLVSHLRYVPATLGAISGALGAALLTLDQALFPPLGMRDPVKARNPRTRLSPSLEPAASHRLEPLVQGGSGLLQKER